MNCYSGDTIAHGTGDVKREERLAKVFAVEEPVFGVAGEIEAMSAAGRALVGGSIADYCALLRRLAKDPEERTVLPGVLLSPAVRDWRPFHHAFSNTRK